MLLRITDRKQLIGRKRIIKQFLMERIGTMSEMFLKMSERLFSQRFEPLRVQIATN